MASRVDATTFREEGEEEEGEEEHTGRLVLGCVPDSPRQAQKRQPKWRRGGGSKSALIPRCVRTRLRRTQHAEDSLAERMALLGSQAAGK